MHFLSPEHFPFPHPHGLSSVISYYTAILSFLSFLLSFKNTLTFIKLNSCSGGHMAHPGPLSGGSDLPSAAGGGVSRQPSAGFYPGSYLWASTGSLPKITPPSRWQPTSDDQLPRQSWAQLEIGATLKACQLRLLGVWVTILWWLRDHPAVFVLLLINQLPKHNSVSESAPSGAQPAAVIPYRRECSGERACVFVAGVPVPGTSSNSCSVFAESNWTEWKGFLSSTSEVNTE